MDSITVNAIKVKIVTIRTIYAKGRRVFPFVLSVDHE